MSPKMERCPLPSPRSELRLNWWAAALGDVKILAMLTHRHSPSLTSVCLTNHVPTRVKGSTKYRWNGQALTLIRMDEAWQEIDHNRITPAAAAIATSGPVVDIPQCHSVGAPAIVQYQ